MFLNTMENIVNMRAILLNLTLIDICNVDTGDYGPNSILFSLLQRDFFKESGPSSTRDATGLKHPSPSVTQ